VMFTACILSKITVRIVFNTAFRFCGIVVNECILCYVILLFLVKFRVMAVDTNLRPFMGTLNKVVIENPSGSRMRQWNDIKLDGGNVFL